MHKKNTVTNKKRKERRTDQAKEAFKHTNRANKRHTKNPASSSGASISVAKQVKHAGELEARETGDEHARDHERDFWERGNEKPLL